MILNRKLPPERARYLITHLITHLRHAGPYRKLCGLIEDRGFLADQALHLDSFGQGTLHFETEVLPVTIEHADWPRFLYHVLVLPVV